MMGQIGTFAQASLLHRGRIKLELTAFIAGLCADLAQLFSGGETTDYSHCSEESAGSNKCLMKTHCRRCAHQQTRFNNITTDQNRTKCTVDGATMERTIQQLTLLTDLGYHQTLHLSCVCDLQ
jgi:hypothetical protein